MAARDVVVVGSGHNALVAACYLARAGLDVEVVERDTVLGGAVSTVERWPGYAVDRGSSVHIMVRHTGIVEDLRLDECGLRYLDMDPWALRAVRPGRRPAGHHLPRRPRRAPARRSRRVCGARDADAYRALRHRLGQPQRGGVRGVRGPAHRGEPRPPPLAGRPAQRRRRAGDVAAVPAARRPAARRDASTDERLKTALAWLGAQSGPPTHEVATADLVGWNALMHSRPPGRAVGGSGALTGRPRGTAPPARRHGPARRRCRRDHPRRRAGHRRAHRLRRAARRPAPWSPAATC